LNKPENHAKRKGNLVIISAPSGAGKTSLVRSLIKSMPDLYLSVSHTTRPARPGERDGVDYHFVDQATFLALAESNQFLEYARVFDHYYGTSRNCVEQQLSAGKDTILEIDWQGARQVGTELPQALKIFILPPSCKLLESRLVGRGDETASISRRMEKARNEISHYREYEFVVINDRFKSALNEIRTIILAARHSFYRQKDYYDDFVRQLLNDDVN